MQASACPIPCLRIWPLAARERPSICDRSLRAAAAHGAAAIVEGAGGVLVPVNDSQTMADLMVMLGLPVIVAARSTLGTINHTLLTIEALRGRELRVAGVVMIGDSNADNRAAIEHYGNVAVVAEMPRFDPLTPE